MRIWLQVGCTPAFPDCPSVQCVDGLEESLGGTADLGQLLGIPGIVGQIEESHC